MSSVVGVNSWIRTVLCSRCVNGLIERFSNEILEPEFVPDYAEVKNVPIENPEIKDMVVDLYD